MEFSNIANFVKILQFPTSSSQLLILLLLLNAPLPSLSAKSNFELIYTNVSCRSQDAQNFVKHFGCTLSKTVKRSSLSIELLLQRDLANFNGNLLITLPRQRSDFVLLNLTNMSGCQLLANQKQVPLLKLGMSSLEHYSNLPHSCPLRKNISYYLRGYRWDLSMVPAFNLEMDMKMWFQLMSNQMPRLEGYIGSRVQRRQQRKGAQ